MKILTLLVAIVSYTPFAHADDEADKALLLAGFAGEAEVAQPEESSDLLQEVAATDLQALKACDAQAHIPSVKRLDSLQDTLDLLSRSIHEKVDKTSKDECEHLQRLVRSYAQSVKTFKPHIATALGQLSSKKDRECADEIRSLDARNKADAKRLGNQVLKLCR